MVLIEPLRSGEKGRAIMPDQNNLEDETRRAWDDYLVKRRLDGRPPRAAGDLKADPLFAPLMSVVVTSKRWKGGELCGLNVLDGDGPGAGGLDFEELRSWADLAGPGVGTGGVDEAVLGAVCAERSHLEVQALVVSGDLDE
jgi:hypothetical protein